MSDSLTIDVDATTLIAQLDRLGPSVFTRVKRVAEGMANRIALEARTRVARRTGETQEGITVDETHNGDGYVVFDKNARMPHLPGWLEFGTKYMTKREFLFPAARLEEGPHARRVEDAIQDAIDEVQG